MPRLVQEKCSPVPDVYRWKSKWIMGHDKTARGDEAREAEIGSPSLGHIRILGVILTSAVIIIIFFELCFIFIFSAGL